MIRFLLLRGWLILIPFILYVLWMIYRRRKALKYSEKLPGWSEGPLLWTCISACLLFVASLFWWGLSEKPNSGTHYKPKQLIDGQLQEESIDQ